MIYLKVERDSYSSTSISTGNSSEITEVPMVSNSEVDGFESSSSTISTCSNQDDVNFYDDNTVFNEPITNLEVCKYIHMYTHYFCFYSA